MSRQTRAIVGVLLAGLMTLRGPVRAQAAPPDIKIVDPKEALGALSGGNSADALAGSLRGVLVRSLPDPLFEDNRHWGQRRPGLRGKLKNDGQWYKIKVRPLNLADTLVLDLRDIAMSEPGRKTFTLFLSFDTAVELERQHWRMGLRLYSGSTRARLRLKLTLRCEAITRTDSKKGLVPDLLFRLRVVESDLRYDNLVVEHTAGVGGDLAKILGHLVVGGIKQVKPSLERELREKANAAIVKAGDTQEVRIKVLNLLSGKNPLSKPNQGE